MDVSPDSRALLALLLGIGVRRVAVDAGFMPRVREDARRRTVGRRVTQGPPSAIGALQDQGAAAK
jgi:hypothetical protein